MSLQAFKSAAMSYQSLPHNLRTDMLIDGEWFAAEGRDRIEVVNPAAGETIALIAAGETADISGCPTDHPTFKSKWRETDVPVWENDHRHRCGQRNRPRHWNCDGRRGSVRGNQ
jgi:hypothetical protein